MRPVLVLQNDADVPPGHLRAVLEDAPGGYEICRLHAGDVVPGFDGWPGVIVLGGAPDDPIAIARSEFDDVWDQLAADGVPLVADRDLA